MTPQEAQKKIAATQKQQQADDLIGMKATTATLPGPLRDVFSPSPEIKVGPYSVRRFVDGDFVSLAATGHPLNHISAIADGSYKFIPTGKDCWILLWILTRPRKESKELFKTGGREGVEEAASDEFGDLPIGALNELMIAVLKQINLYGETHLEYEPKAEDEKSQNPPLSPPLPTA